MHVRVTGAQDAMTSTQPKLMTKGKLALCLAAGAVGASVSLVREYRATGTVQTQSIVISLIVLCVCISIILVVGWWANRPESGASDE
jgi:type III secretory pathway component EscS